MYLLNDQQIAKHVQAPLGHYLDILNFDKASLQHTSYYFRLGEDCKILGGTAEQQIQLTEEKPYLMVPPNGYAVVRTHEVFFFSDKVMGVIGQRTELAERGLQLVYSPFIDPLFRGALVLGLSNHLPKTVRIPLLKKIGKVSFFDISDTYPVQVIEGSISERTFDMRRPRRDDDPVPSWVEDEDPDIQ